MTNRKVADCRKFPSDNGCSLTIAGTEDEVMKVAVSHAIADHGEKDSPEMREMIRSTLSDEDDSAGVPAPPESAREPTLIT